VCLQLGVFVTRATKLIDPGFGSSAYSHRLSFPLLS
jgi:hypothetical protein